jgi:hypothetical protein
VSSSSSPLARTASHTTSGQTPQSRQIELSTSQIEPYHRPAAKIPWGRGHIPAQAAAGPHPGPGEGTAPASHAGSSGLKARRARGCKEEGGAQAASVRRGGRREQAASRSRSCATATCNKLKGHAAHGAHSATGLFVPTWFCSNCSIVCAYCTSLQVVFICVLVWIL